MKNTVKIVKDYWENKSSKRISHLLPRYNLDNNRGMTIIEQMKKMFIEEINWKNKTVIDYGIGSSLIAQYLFKENLIRKYIGYDISSKSIEYSKSQLKAYLEKVEYILLEGQEYDFYKWNADIFISLACIQHFPSEKYLITFLEAINESKIPKVVLQIRHGKENFFYDTPYEGDSSILRANYTNNKFIEIVLTYYKNVYQTKPNPKSRYQYLIYDRQ